MNSHSSATTLVVFSHGKESGPWGSKIRHLAEVAERLGAIVLSPEYGDLNEADARVDRLLALSLPVHQKLVLVGSSMGGYVSIVASRRLQPDGLFLMAPAIGLPNYAEPSPEPGTPNMEIVMGWQDEVISSAQIVDYAQGHRARLHLLNADHRLNSLLFEVGRLFELFLQRVMVQDISSSGKDTRHE